MLKSFIALKGDELAAKDGTIGLVEDVFFDDASWVVRYLVVRTSRWLLGRRVLLSPGTIGAEDQQNHQIHVDLTREQVRHSPPVSSDRPATRAEERAHHTYWGVPFYWTYVPVDIDLDRWPSDGPYEGTIEHEPSLYSAKDLLGWKVNGDDGRLGHVDDVLIQSDTWQIEHVAVEPEPSSQGHRRLIPTSMILGLDCFSRAVDVNATRNQVRFLPEIELPSVVSAPSSPRMRLFRSHSGR